jgi:hypothetical protein
MTEAKIWQCEFENKRSGPVIVYEYQREMLIIPPGKKALLRMWDAYQPSYARFSTVVYGPGPDEVHVTVNRDWRPPDNWADKYVLELANNGRNPYEIVRDSGLGDAPVVVMHGIPKLVAVGLESYLAKFSKIEWRIEDVRQRVGNYWVSVPTAHKVEILRGEGELKRIRQRIIDKYKNESASKVKSVLKRLGLE